MDFDLQELQQADQYDDIIAKTIEVDTLQALPTQPFDDGLRTRTIPATESIITGGVEDDSEIVEHVRTKTTDPSRFRIALGLWCQETGISRPQYASLLEILRMPELPQEVHKLPSCLSTLKRQTTAQLPLLLMRKKSISLQSEQLGKDKIPTATCQNQEDLFFFDPVSLFTAFLRSDIRSQMYFGLGEFRDNPIPSSPEPLPQNWPVHDENNYDATTFSARNWPQILIEFFDFYIIW